MTVLNLNASVDDKIYCEVDIATPQGCAHKVKLLVETGSSVSILPQSLYEDYFTSTLLLLPTGHLFQTALACTGLYDCYSDS